MVSPFDANASYPHLRYTSHNHFSAVWLVHSFFNTSIFFFLCGRQL